MDRQSLLTLFEYDLWANRLWLPVLDSMPDPERAKKVFLHILGCQWSWLTVVLSEEEAGPKPTMDFEAELVRFHEAWKDVILNGDPNAFASYSRGDQTFFQMVSEVAMHVVNHGTYHRGHLRGLMDAAGSDSFEDTDFIKYVRIHGSQG